VPGIKVDEGMLERRPDDGVPVDLTEGAILAKRAEGRPAEGCKVALMGVGRQVDKRSDGLADDLLA